MTMRFKGTLAQLQAMLAENEIEGHWEDEPNGVHLMRCAEGGNMHWASGSKTLWFDGPERARLRLRRSVEFAVLTADDE